MMMDSFDPSEFSLGELESIARKCQAHISENLPKGVDPLSFPNLNSKTPYIAICYREAQYCRFEELGRAACDLFERNDVVAANICVRAMLETSACVWFLMELLQKEVREGLSGKVHEKIVQLLMGQRCDPESNLPISINVLTIVDHADKKLPGLRKHYDRLSEFAHPNWSGALGAYGDRDDETLITWFRSDKASLEYPKRIGLSLMVLTMQMIEEAYNEVLEAAFAYGKLEDG